MKLICSILAIIILAMSCIPCSDAKSIAMPNNQPHTTITADEHHPHTSDNAHKDLCSPFCQCSCCAIAYALPATLVSGLAIRDIIFDKAFASYLQQRPVGIAIPIWQPPRLV